MSESIRPTDAWKKLKEAQDKHTKEKEMTDNLWKCTFCGDLIPHGAGHVCSCPVADSYDKVNECDVGRFDGPSVYFEALGADVGNLVDEKQKAYGDSFGRSGACLREMFPDGIRPEQYDDLLTIARILDKLFRIASDPDAFAENPYRDIAGYGLLGMKRYEDKK